MRKITDEERIEEFFMNAHPDLIARQQEKIALIVKLRQRQGELPHGVMIGGPPVKPARKPRAKRGDIELKEPGV